MNNVPDYSVIVTKCQNDEEKEIELQKQRKILSHKVYDHEKWPLFTFQMIESPNSRILMVSLDLMVLGMFLPNMQQMTVEQHVEQDSKLT